VKTGAGPLNRRVQIQRRIEVDDDTGDPIPSWPLFAEVWGALEPARGRELITEAELVTEYVGRIRIRYLPGVTAKMRAVVGQVIYNIEAVIDLLDRHEEMHLLVSYGIADG
jgi:SPP1 family predicted phage head-tail adaptor